MKIARRIAEKSKQFTHSYAVKVRVQSCAGINL